MRQHWGKLLFMHWPIDEKLLRPLIPAQLAIDSFDGSAWIGVVPFTMWGIRASFLPPIPGTSAFHELNVRTYVTLNGIPGVWFFSLDAANRLAVWAARKFYNLPYFNAQMSLDQTDKTIHYSSTRQDARGAPAELKTTWVHRRTFAAIIAGLNRILFDRALLPLQRKPRQGLPRTNSPPAVAVASSQTQFV